MPQAPHTPPLPFHVDQPPEHHTSVSGDHPSEHHIVEPPPAEHVVLPPKQQLTVEERLARLEWHLGIGN